MSSNYFVTVYAPDRQKLGQLRDFDLDLFSATARVGEGKNGASIQGLLTLEEIGKLVDTGYQVLVSEHESKRSRAQTEIAKFDDWIRVMEKRRQ